MCCPCLRALCPCPLSRLPDPQGNAPSTVNKTAARRASLEFPRNSMQTERAASGVLPSEAVTPQLASGAASQPPGSSPLGTPGTAARLPAMAQSPEPSPASQTAIAAFPAASGRAGVCLGSLFDSSAAAHATTSDRQQGGAGTPASPASVVPSEEVSAKGGAPSAGSTPPSARPLASCTGGAGSPAGTVGATLGGALVPAGQADFIPQPVTPEIERWLQVRQASSCSLAVATPALLAWFLSSVPAMFPAALLASWIGCAVGGCCNACDVLTTMS